MVRRLGRQAANAEIVFRQSMMGAVDQTGLGNVNSVTLQFVTVGKEEDLNAGRSGFRVTDVEKEAGGCTHEGSTEGMGGGHRLSNSATRRCS